MKNVCREVVSLIECGLACSDRDGQEAPARGVQMLPASHSPAVRGPLLQARGERCKCPWRDDFRCPMRPLPTSRALDWLAADGILGGSQYLAEVAGLAGACFEKYASKVRQNWDSKKQTISSELDGCGSGSWVLRRAGVSCSCFGGHGCCCSPVQG